MMESELNIAQVYSRLRKSGINISDQKEVVLALESEARHYRSVIQELSKRNGLPQHPSEEHQMVYDWDSCRSPELSRMLHEINTYGYEIVSVTQWAEVYTVFFKRPDYG